MKPIRLEHPIILIHGWTDNPASTGTFKVVEHQLKRNAIFDAPHLARFGSVKERADLLIKYIMDRKGFKQGQKLHLIGHSLGGIVAREVAGRSDLAFTVLTVTTLGSPNHGLKYLDRLPTLAGDSPEAEIIRFFFGTDFGGLFNLSSKAMEEFNKETQNNPDVRYFSWAGEIVIPTVSYTPHSLFVDKFYSKSDGIVGVDSAEWDPELLGPGTHLGTVPGLTHSSIVCNEIFAKTLPHLRAAELEEEDSPVEKVSRSVKKQLTRRFTGHADALQGRVMAMRDGLKGHSHRDSDGKDAHGKGRRSTW